MFDIGSVELLMVAVIALLVIGPKDLPKAMRVVGHWVGKARGMARQLRTGFDDIVRESEMADLEKKWADENERIMREFPTQDGDGAADDDNGPQMRPLPAPAEDTGGPTDGTETPEPLLPGIEDDKGAAGPATDPETKA